MSTNRTAHTVPTAPARSKSTRDARAGVTNLTVLHPEVASQATAGVSQDRQDDAFDVAGGGPAIPAVVAAQAPIAPLTASQPEEVEERLPLPGWLRRFFALFAIVLYVPDALFNYYVYSDGAHLPTGNPIFQIAQVALWLFLAFGVVGMAWLCSVLAPWHWSRGRRIVGFFCGLGVLIAMSVTTWCSLAFRSATFVQFPTDQWVYPLLPWLAQHNVSVTMIMVAIAPPFWGLFWAIIQPTETRRSRSEIVASHQQRMLRMEQEAEIKALKALTNANIRQAQIAGMAQTAAAARDQAKTLLGAKAAPTTARDPETPIASTIIKPATDAAPLSEPGVPLQAAPPRSIPATVTTETANSPAAAGSAQMPRGGLTQYAGPGAGATASRSGPAGTTSPATADGDGSQAATGTNRLSQFFG